MPYIKKADRPDAIVEPRNPGELNFCISEIIAEYIANRGLSYDTLNGAIGVLECSKLELGRRIINPYEDIKIAENGDIPGYERLSKLIKRPY